MNQDFLWIEQLKFNEQGLIPAIAQDYRDGTILMMAWMNKESIQQTLTTKEAHYWSRSRQELWHKGATSGHIQKVKKFYYDCDADTLLLKIEQVGDVACHTGKRSCFFKSVPIN
ncbi:phosphoribosyl-AMP cyclohydrolase [Candidatus Gracilibacteria bacterium]|nr:phosphoribosyl-AMP cyclohydrolase [Candidatus Gracilibacteria bacterium]NJM90522.1 phosphoribosyl-AMP cyclohydrolase [Hydrococcus sp. RU_2_2]NJP19796.1 phosphoribosyl-AMP cyclohydrolase [Hydrococcus sp. CRU_1_1]NJQ98626.1 phosphoribosyl-AMP cyclohydrolase [Hydrococcus sp. CSU_1_8]